MISVMRKLFCRLPGPIATVGRIVARDASNDVRRVTQMNTEPVNSRRSFLRLLPFGVLAGVFATIGGAAFRFLRPRVMAASEQWLDVAAVAELGGPQPVAKKVFAEQVSGWAVTLEEHNVF